MVYNNFRTHSTTISFTSAEDFTKAAQLGMVQYQIEESRLVLEKNEKYHTEQRTDLQRLLITVRNLNKTLN